MPKYGQTWWGGEWMKALSHIDYSNRLPRGRNYANKGAVREITLKSKTIKALVQGTRSTPYKVTVKTPGFTAAEKTTMTSAILENPLLLTRLLNRELPPQLHQIAAQNNIRIFPGRWNDLEMNCSCPDWAVPCKHLAAVINVIANEIDRNPFLLFKFHDYNIVEELSKHELDASNVSAGIFNMAQIYTEVTTENDKPGHDSTAAPGTGEQDPGSTAALADLDFSAIENMRDTILSLLPEKPLFYPGDFKAVTEKLYKMVSKSVTKQLEMADEGHQNGINYEKFNEVQITLREDIFFSSYRFLNQHISGEESVTFTTAWDLISFLAEIPPKFSGRLQGDLAFLYFTLLFARRLAEQSAFIPQIVRLSNDSYTVRWIPALMNTSVKKIFNSLVRACPPSLTLSGNKTMFIKREEQVNTLISAFIKDFIYETGLNKTLKMEPASEIFVSDVSHRFDGPGEMEIPGTIQKWTDKLYIAENQLVPVLEINEENHNGRFTVNILVENRKEPLKEPVSLREFMTLPEYAERKIDILRTLDLLTSSFPALETVIATSGDKMPSFTSDEFAGLMFKIIPVIKNYGIRVILPKALKNLVRPKISMSLSSSATAVKSFLNLEKILEFQWKIALGDILIDKEEFRGLVSGLSGIVKLKEQYVYLNQADLKELMESASRQEMLNRNQLLQAAVTGEYNGARISIDGPTRELIDSLLQVSDIELPAGLNASLRPYQKRGYDWLVKNSQIGFGSIIADDMGLGKTLQVIAIILKLKNEGELNSRKALVVVPTTLITNWQKEFDKFAPSIRYSVYHGQVRALDMGTDVIITSYGIARSDNELLGKHKWKLVVIDEAQNIKNPGTAQTKAIKKLKSDIRIGMSGTPVENRLTEYWSIFDFTNKGYMGNMKHFTQEYAIPIEVSRNRKKLDRFLQITGPFILRRLKTDKSVISDLPEKIENDYFASLIKEQAAIYQNVLENVMAQIENVDTTEEGGNIQRRGLVLKLIMALKQICNHPSQYLKKESASPDLSGKAGVFLDLARNIAESDEKVLVFTQFREMGVLLQRMIKEQLDIDSMFLHGGTPRKQRDQMVERFQNDPHEKVFLLSIKAGGTGLNLTSASHVVHYDLWWNPAVETQATDRAYRIGQHKNVMVYRLITRGTFEEKINAMLADKKDLANLTVTAGEKWIGELSNSELKKLFTI